MTKYTGESSDFLGCVTSGKRNQGHGRKNEKTKEGKRREAERDRRKLKM
jgi:hypothetical protein